MFGLPARLLYSGGQLFPVYRLRSVYRHVPVSECMSGELYELLLQLYTEWGGKVSDANADGGD